MSIMLSGREQMENNYKNKSEYIIKQRPELQGFFNSLNMEKSSAYEYINHIYKFLMFTGKEISDLNYDDFITFLNRSKKVASSSAPTTSSYQILIYSALKKFSHYCYVSEKTNRDYMRDVERPKATQSQKTITKRKQGVLSVTELSEYIKNIKNDYVENAERHIAPVWRLRNWCMIQLFLTTGIRCSALRNLDLGDVDFEQNKIRVIEKGNKYREITINNNMVDELKKWVTERNKIMDGIDSNALFISTHKERISNKSISRAVEKYARGIEGKHISPHKLRATFATMLYENTNDILAVKETLGHASIKTSQLYIRQDKDMSQIASGIMGKIIGATR